MYLSAIFMWEFIQYQCSRCLFLWEFTGQSTSTIYFYTYAKRLENDWSIGTVRKRYLQIRISDYCSLPYVGETPANDTEKPEFCQFPNWSSFLQEFHQLNRAKLPISFPEERKYICFSIIHTDGNAEFNDSVGKSGSLLEALPALL